MAARAAEIERARRLRDLHTAAQHAVVQQRHYAAAGKIAGEQFRRRLTAPRHLIAS
jgi:hypothetical protein